MLNAKYKKVLLKLSGQYHLILFKLTIIDFDILKDLAQEVKKVQQMGAKVGIVIGGGNFWRGAFAKEIKRAQADYIGMLATIMNSLAMCDTFNSCGLEARVQTLIPMPQLAETYSRAKALSYIKEDKVVIFGGGSGSPYFSTDTASVLRAIDIEADVILKVTHTVDGVYNKDPAKNPDAVKYDSLTFKEAHDKHLAVMDETAMVLCEEHNIPIVVFCGTPLSNISEVICGTKIGTIIKN